MGKPFKMKGWSGYNLSPLRTDKTKGGPKKNATNEPKTEITWQERTYSDPTTTTGEWEDLGGGKQQRRITTSRNWEQEGKGKRKRFSDLEDPEAAKKWAKENPEEYKRMLSKSQKRSGTEESERIETRTVPTEPKEPKRKAEYYKFRSNFNIGQTRGGETSLKRAQQSTPDPTMDIDIVYDSKAYGPGGLGRLIQTKEAANLNKIREGRKDNPNWKKDLAEEKQRFANIKKVAAKWRKEGSIKENMPPELKEYMARIGKASERVQQQSNDTEKAYISTF